MTEPKRPLSPLAIVLLLSGVFFVAFMVISGVFFLHKAPSGIHGNRTTAPLFGGDSVGVIEIKGAIMESRKTLARLERFENDDAVKAVVLRMNSPGGAVGPAQEIYEAVQTYPKPIVVSMGSMAASAAYYIACGAKKIFANPGTMTGSIGVIMEFVDLAKLYEWAKIQRYSVKSGKFKDVGADYRAMTPEEHALLQSMIDDVLGQFKKAVEQGRKLSAERVSAIADGRIFSGHQAKEAGLVDELGSFRDAVKEAARLGGIKGKPTVVYIEKQKRGLLDLLLDDSSEESGSAESSWEEYRLLRHVLTLLKRLRSNVD